MTTAVKTRPAAVLMGRIGTTYAPWAVVGVALVLAAFRLPLASQFIGFTSDMGSYLMTRNWVLGNDPTGQMIFHFRPPLVGVLLVPFTTVWGDLLGSKLLALAASVTIGPAAYILARRFASPMTSVLAAVVLMVHPFNAYYTGGGYLALLAVVAAAVGLALLVDCLNGKKVGPWLALVTFLIVGLNQTIVPLYGLTALALVTFHSGRRRRTLLWLAIGAAASVIWLPFYLLHGGVDGALRIEGAPFLSVVLKPLVVLQTGIVMAAWAFVPRLYPLVLVSIVFGGMAQLVSADIVLNNVLQRGATLVPLLACVSVAAALSQLRVKAEALGVAAVAMLVLGGITWQRGFTAHATEIDMLTPDNLAAIEWVGNNTPSDAKVMTHPNGLGWWVGGLAPRAWGGTWGHPPAALEAESAALNCALGWRGDCDPYELRDRFGFHYLLIDRTSWAAFHGMPGVAAWPPSATQAASAWKAADSVPWLREQASFGDVMVYDFVETNNVQSATFPAPVQASFIDGDWYVAHQDGLIERVTGEKAVLLDIRDRVLTREDAPELGLQSFLINNKATYAAYNGLDAAMVVSEFRDGQERVLVRADRPVEPEGSTGLVHNGGALAFGPDGTLYASFGESAFADSPPNLYAQDPDSLWGSIIRIDPDTGEAATYATGFRNPWRMAFTEDGRLLATDVGQGTWEEINDVREGGNYGWPVMEGPECYTDARGRIGDAVSKPAAACDPLAYDAPLYAYPHTGRECAVIGGDIHKGRYLFGDFCSGDTWALDYRTGEVEHLSQRRMMVRGVVSDGERLYILGAEYGQPFTLYEVAP